MKALIKRLWINRKYCYNLAIKWTGAIFTLWSVIALFVPFDEIIRKDTQWYIKLLIALIIVTMVFVVTYIIGIFIALNKNVVELIEVGDNHHVYVQYGNVFSHTILGKSTLSNKRNILISANRCFDTIVDNDLISNNSLHGTAINNLVSNSIAIDKIDKEIQKQLKNENYTILQRCDKPRGNLKRYPEGVVVEIKESNEITYFFLGLASFDKQLHPYITDVEYVNAMIKALKYCFARNQGYPVIIPLIGGGRSETKKEEKDILEFLVKLIQINKQSINCDIHIVIRETAKDTISITNLK